MANGPKILTFEDSRSRREAKTFDWEELTGLQQSAVLNCHRLIEELASHPYKRAPKREGFARFVPKIDLERRNNAVLIDGRRGSGKTLALFTLLRYWIGYSPLLRGLLTDEHQADALIKAMDFTLYPETLRNRSDSRARAAGPDPKERDTDPDCEGKRPVIIPIGPVDLQYLSPHTQIIPLIVGAFDEVVQGLRERQGRGDRQDPPAWLSSGHAPSASERWRELVSSASSWEMDSHHRAGHVDPEEHFLEVAELEKHRAKLQQKFRAFADALCDEFMDATRSSKPPMFVLCIDDADMKPKVSVRLLEALRVLYHPRVAFLLTGNTELFLNMLTDSFFAGLRAPLQRIDLLGDKSDEMNDRSFASRLAREVYDKIIPVGHRIEVPPLDAEARRVILDDVIKRVGTELVNRVANNRRTDEYEFTLEWYLVNDRHTLNALPEQLRGMWSLRDFVRDEIESREDGTEHPAGRKQYQALPISVANKLWQDALADSLLNREDIESLKHAIRIETHPTFRFFVDTRLITKTILSVPIRGHQDDDGFTITFRRIDGYEMSMVNRPDVLLSSSSESALILASNLAADYRAGDFVVPSLSPDEFDNPFVAVGFSSESAEGIVDVAWPLPDWDSFADFHIFSNAWLAAVFAEPAAGHMTQRELENLLGRLVRRFILLVLAVMEHRDDPSQIGRLSESAAPTWETIRRRLADVADKLQVNPRPRALINTRWLRSRLGLLAAPESLLPSSEARALASLLSRQYEEDWKRVSAEIRRARRERLRRSYVHTGKERGSMLENASWLYESQEEGGRPRRAMVQAKVELVIKEIEAQRADAAQIWNDFTGPGIRSSVSKTARKDSTRPSRVRAR